MTKSSKGRKLPTPRNPYVAHTKRRGHNVIDQRHKDAQKDGWSRKAKHKDDKMKQLDEHVMGMTNVNSLTRIQELAGIKPVKHIKELDELGDEFYIPTYDDGEELETIDAPIEPVDALPAPEDEFDAEIDSEIGADEIGPEEPIGTAYNPVIATSSPAFIEISAKVSEIETQLENIKVSEYKEVTTLLRDLYQRVRSSGFDFLQEGRELKK